MSKVRSTLKCALLYLAIALAISFTTGGRLWAQAQNATITGTATDSSGAAIVGAKIEAINESTNVVRSTVSDAQGRYTLPDLPVGTYTVRASQSGFQTVSHTGVTLSVGGSVVVSLSLPVGSVSQTVSVESQVSRVETTSSQVSTLVSPKQMRELPLNGRNFEQLLALAPGVTTIAPGFNAVTGRLYGMMNNYSVAGSRPTGQMFLLDGTDIRDFWQHATGSGYAGTSLGVEAIGQFQVLTNSYTAQYGGNGAVMNAVSRSGTNSLHGGAYEFIRNSRLDALDAPDKIAGLTTPPPFKRNQFGVAVGGPIKKNKIFFFGNYEGLREGLEKTTPVDLPASYVTAGMLPCYDVVTGAAVNALNPGCPAPPATPAAGQSYPAVGTAANPILPNTLGANPQIQAISSLYSLCQGCKLIQSTQTIAGTGTAITFAPGTDLGGYYTAKTAPNLITNEDYTLGRVDYTISSSDNMFARYVLDDARVDDNPRDVLGIFPEKDFTRNQFLTITENHVFSATMINAIRFGFVRTNENSRVQQSLTSAQISAASQYSTANGGPAFTTDPLDFMRTNGVKEPNREDGQSVAFAGIPVVGPDQNRPDTLIQNKFSGGDDLSWTHGGHSLKLGIVVTRIQTQNLQSAYANGTYYLTYAVGPPFNTAQWYLSGTPLVTFAVPAGFNNATRYFREIAVAPYIQDDWKVTPRLTLNLGFRYDYNTNPIGWAAGNKSLTSLVGSFLPPVGPVTPPGNVSASGYTPVTHVFATNPNLGNFQPRVGFAYSPFEDNKTAFRGGFGVFFDPTAARLWESNFINTPPSAFSLLILSGFPDPYVGGLGQLLGIKVAPGQFAGVTYQVPHGSPYQLQYNFNVQRQLTPSTILTVGYVGSVSRHLWTQGDINPPMCTTFPNCTALPKDPTSRPTASDATYTFIPGTVGGCSAPAQNPDPFTGAPGTGCYGSGVQFPCLSAPVTPSNPTGTPGPPCSTQGPRINQNFGAMVQAQNTGSASYNSLQVSLNHQFASNFTAQVNYTWSHCVDDGSFASSLESWGQLVTNRYNQSYDYENCNFDIRNNFNANALYTLPFKGNRLVEGWRIATIIGIHSGLPVNITNSAALFPDPADLGTQWTSRANYSYAPGCHPNHLLKKVVGTGTVQWFDPSCYEAQAPGFLGNVRRNSVGGPGTISADLSLTKETKLTESLNMEFRVEAFNFINHWNPGVQSSSTGAVLGYINLPGGTSGQTNYSQAPVVTPRQIQFALKFDF